MEERCTTEGRNRTSDNNVIDIFGGAPFREVGMDAVYVVDVEEATFGTSEETRIVLDGVAFCRGVDDGEHFFEVFLEELVGWVEG